MKKCFKCGKEKDLSEFYKHKQMSDGHLNKCKECTKNDAKSRERLKRQDLDWIVKERERGREKYHRLNYKDRSRVLSKKPYRKASRKLSMDKYNTLFPEKKRAKNKSSHIFKPGYEKHHWSYVEGDEKSVVFINKRDHSLVHRKTVYDQERFRYRRVDNMELIDSVDLFLDYIKEIGIKDFEVYDWKNGKK